MVILSVMLLAVVFAGQSLRRGASIFAQRQRMSLQSCVGQIGARCRSGAEHFDGNVDSIFDDEDDCVILANEDEIRAFRAAIRKAVIDALPQSQRRFEIIYGLLRIYKALLGHLVIPNK